MTKDNRDVSNADKNMSDAVLARNLFHDAFPVSRYGKVDAALYAAYRFMKPKVEPRISRPFTMRRVRSLHEGTVARVDGAEWDALKAAQIEEAKREHTELRQRLAYLDETLALLDEEFHGPQREALREQVRG